jgi:shikimate kinase
MAPPASPFDRPIALVGMPGAGKTSVGRLLAERLGLGFRDTDEEVVRETGRTVEQLFVMEGVAAFRRHERQAVARLVDSSRLVIATGGGAMVEPRTRRLLLSRTIPVWLQASPETLMRRLAEAPPRPLLIGGGLLVKLKAMAAERQRFYEQAHIHLRTDKLGLVESAEAAADALEAWQARP